MKAAAFDLGTNSFLCIVGEKNSNNELVVHMDLAKVVRLGQGMYGSEPKSLQAQALQRAKNCLEEFHSQAKEAGASKFKAVATSAARDANNSEELHKVCRDLGIDLEVISGVREAELTFYGAYKKFDANKNTAVIDIGGGSTEFLFYQAGAGIEPISLNVGAVRLTEMFLTQAPNLDLELVSLREFVKTEFKKLPLKKLDELVAVAGTPTCIASVELGLRKFDPAAIDSFLIKKEALGDFIKRLSRLSLQERRGLPGMQEGREDVLIAGAILLEEAMEYFELKSLQVSSRGLRYGLLQEIL